MQRIISLASAILLATFGLQPAMAAINFSDGGTHAVNAPSADISLSNATTLNLAPGASITAPAVTVGVSAYDGLANQIHMTGGMIVGGSDPQNLGGVAAPGIGMQGGLADISGGTVSGGSASFIPGNAIDTRFSQVSISGGTFHGGDITDFGYAADAVVINGGSLEISGGTFYGGNGYFAGIAVSLAKGNAPVPAYALITGGTFVAGTGSGIGGFAPFALAIGYNTSATMDLKGGQFTGDFYLEEGSVLNVYGHGLALSNNGRHIAGTLLDGTPLSVDAYVKATATVNLINVPEPATGALAALGCLLLIGRRGLAKVWPT